MFCSSFQDLKISRLGFGMMRLPLKEDKSVDEAKVFQMVDYALDRGVNYFDTAFPYLNGESEIVTGKALGRHPRSSFLLATKYPGHQIAEEYHPAEIFEQQLKKCGVDYFDFYLLHNVCESSLPVYLSPKWGIIDYFLEQRRKGRIRHLGLSSHARPDTLRNFLERYGREMEFCQIQLNYLDWTLQDARGKCDILKEFGIPVWVMEPVRGGKLAQLPAEQLAKLSALRPGSTAASWAFRWLQQFPEVKVVLSGMSNMAQMDENIRLFSEEAPLTDGENGALLAIAEELKQAVPCTGCGYCRKGCPMGLDIPLLLKIYSDLRYAGVFTTGMQMDVFPAEKLPSACLGCGACSSICPQKLDIPALLKDFAERLKVVPKWADICRERAAASKAKTEK